MIVPKSLITTGVFGGIITTLGAFATSTEVLDYGGTAFGYLLFLFDFMLIFMIFKIITQGVSDESGRGVSAGLLTMLVTTKLVGLVGAVYLGLAVWRLSVGYIFVGMLASVVLIGIWIAVSYYSGKSGFEK